MSETKPAERPTWVDDELFPFRSRFVELDGNVVHYVDEGDGPTLLMLHGNPVWSFVYREVITALRGKFRCIAVDLPGFGLSTAAPGYDFTAQEHADLVVTFLERMSLTGLTLVGHNWGGPLGLYAAEQRPGTFDRLVLSNTWAWPLNGDPASELFSRGMGGPLGRALIKRFDLLGRFFIPSAHKLRTLSQAEMAHYRKATPTSESRHAGAVLPGQLVGAREFFTEVEADLDSIRQLPTLIVWGEKDPIFTHKYLTRLEAGFPHHTTKLLRGVGHFAQSDAPEQFAEAVDTWCTESTSDGGTLSS